MMRHHSLTLRAMAPMPARQRGAILITSLIFLMVLTMFVLAMVRGGSLEERMARNSRDQKLALEAAEAVLRDAESILFTQAPFDPFDSAQFQSSCANGLCYRPAAANTWQNIDWSATAVTRTFDNAATQISGLTVQPRYVVEVVTPPTKSSSSGQCEPGLARITARGQGNGGAIALIQSTVRFRVFTNICG